MAQAGRQDDEKKALDLVGKVKLRSNEGAVYLYQGTTVNCVVSFVAAGNPGYANQGQAAGTAIHCFEK